MTQQIINTSIVTQEQLDAASRIIGPDGEVFYLVQSASDPDVEYKVEARRKSGNYYLVCTCKAGQEGRSCWHKRAAAAHAQEYKAEQKALALREARVERLTRMGLAEREAREAVAAYFIVDGKPADDKTLVRVFGPHKQPNPREVEADSHRYQGCTFSLLK